jgi:preprotein translocase SecE subunit
VYNVPKSPRRRFYFDKLNLMSNLSNYLKETVAEMKQVSWPSQKQASIATVLVVVISAIVSIFLGVFDFAFGKAIDFIINRI